MNYCVYIKVNGSTGMHRITRIRLSPNLKEGQQNATKMKSQRAYKNYRNNKVETTGPG